MVVGLRLDNLNIGDVVRQTHRQPIDEALIDHGSEVFLTKERHRNQMPTG